jgi:hypothetical protein
MVTLKPWKWFRRKPKPTEDQWINEAKMPGILIQTKEGYSEMKKVINVSGEFLVDPYDKERKNERKEVIYTGMPAHILNISDDIFAGIVKFFFKFKYPHGLRLRTYHRLYDEPCTRNLFSGQLLRPEKKQRVLIEKGIIDKEGYYLKPKEFNEAGIQTGGGGRYVLKGCWIKPDFSDVDFIKSEFHAYKQSEIVQKVSKAMSKTGQTFDKWYYIVIITAVIGMVLVVFITSGVIK